VKYIPVTLFNKEHDCSILSFTIPLKTHEKDPMFLTELLNKLKMLISKEMMAEGRD
jgi:hypothetical protein